MIVSRSSSSCTCALALPFPHLAGLHLHCSCPPAGGPGRWGWRYAVRSASATPRAYSPSRGRQLHRRGPPTHAHEDFEPQQLASFSPSSAHWLPATPCTRNACHSLIHYCTARSYNNHDAAAADSSYSALCKCQPRACIGLLVSHSGATAAAAAGPALWRWNLLLTLDMKALQVSVACHGG